MKREERKGGWREEKEDAGRGVIKGEEGGEKWREEERRKREGGLSKEELRGEMREYRVEE